MNHDYILLDRSGSMAQAGKWGDSIAAINSYVRGLTEKKVDTGVTLVAFDQDYGRFCFEIIRDRIIPATWRDVLANELYPRGWTPLNDAIMRMIELANRAGHQNRDHVAFVILTDGMENASDIKTPRAGVKAAIDSCRARGWEFIFIGANFDNWTQAEGYGALRQHTYAATALNEVNVMGTLSMNRASKVAGQCATMDFTNEQKAKLDETNN